RSPSSVVRRMRLSSHRLTFGRVRRGPLFGTEHTARDLTGQSSRSGRRQMKRALLVGVAVLAGTYSAAAADFYVVQDTSTKQCRVVEQKPTGSTLVIVGGESRTFATQAEAEMAMKNESACNQTAQAPTASQTAQAPKSENPPSTTGAAPANVQIIN